MNTTSSTTTSMKVSELRQELKKRGLDTTGLKDALIKRIEDAISQEDCSPSVESPTESVQSEVCDRVFANPCTVFVHANAGFQRTESAPTSLKALALDVVVQLLTQLLQLALLLHNSLVFIEQL